MSFSTISIQIFSFFFLLLLFFRITLILARFYPTCIIYQFNKLIRWIHANLSVEKIREKTKKLVAILFLNKKKYAIIIVYTVHSYV